MIKLFDSQYYFKFLYLLHINFLLFICQCSCHSNLHFKILSLLVGMEHLIINIVCGIIAFYCFISVGKNIQIFYLVFF